jgi:hypothetical protein
MAQMSSFLTSVGGRAVESRDRRSTAVPPGRQGRSWTRSLRGPDIERKRSPGRQGGAVGLPEVGRYGSAAAEDRLHGWVEHPLVDLTQPTRRALWWHEVLGCLPVRHPLSAEARSPSGPGRFTIPSWQKHLGAFWADVGQRQVN